MWGTLSIQVVGNGLNAFDENACDPTRSSGCPRPSPLPPQKVDRTYDGTSHFGEGIHTERSTSDLGETFEVTYRIDVSPVCPSCVVQQPGGGRE
jgi:hypothetical protein